MAKIVLVVDDHDIVRKMVCSMFIAKGFEVYYAENGAQAVEKAQELHPHLVVLDLAMPVMDGLEAARKSKMLMPSLPLLMLQIMWVRYWSKRRVRQASLRSYQSPVC